MVVLFLPPLGRRRPCRGAGRSAARTTSTRRPCCLVCQHVVVVEGDKKTNGTVGRATNRKCEGAQGGGCHLCQGVVCSRLRFVEHLTAPLQRARGKKTTRRQSPITVRMKTKQGQGWGFCTNYGRHSNHRFSRGLHLSTIVRPCLNHRSTSI